VKDHIHYESAFEDYLQRQQIPYVAVDEAKRAAFRDAKLKSFDFIVYSRTQANWLVDIKGRRWAARAGNRRPPWENWVTQADIDGLDQWEHVFGAGFQALLVFAYRLDERAAEAPAQVVHQFRGQPYVFAAVPLAEYRTHARLRSPKWETVNMPTREFARHVRPIADWL
jgi:hypothetical protein